MKYSLLGPSQQEKYFEKLILFTALRVTEGWGHAIFI